MARKTRKSRATKVPVQVEQVAQVEEQVVEVESDVSTVPQGTVEAQVTEAKPAKQAKVAKAKTPATPKKPSGAGAAIKLLLFKSPNLTVQEITDALGDAAPSKQTVMLIRYETRQALKLLAQEGMLKEGFPAIN